MLDYKKLNFKCGIEIHKQLDSNKLFCSCPSIIDNSEPELRITRKLRAVAGESGEKDVATLHEESKDKEFIYEFSKNYACLVDLDEEPPHSINQKALEIALEIALLLNAKIESELKILRKTIIDGSDISGFQKTVLIAKNGFIKTSKGKVKISHIYLEEDAARKIKEEGNKVTYCLDRLGIPLVEISTSADIKDAEHAKETASLLGMMLKSTGKVKAGIGTIRQDINLSIKNGKRVELKGFQDLRNMPKVTEKEIERQLSLINQGKKVQEEVRKVNEDNSTSFLRPLPGQARMYIETDLSLIKITKQMLSKIKIPELISEKTMGIEKKYKIAPLLARQIIKEKINLDYYIKKYPNINPAYLAETLISYKSEIPRAYEKADPSKINEKHLEKIFTALNNAEISKNLVMEILTEIALGKELNIEKYKLIKISDEELKKEIQTIIEINKGASFNAVMGECMKKFKGKVDPKKVAEILKILLH